MKKWHVYFLKSNKLRWYYVGSTNRLYERMEEHNKGKVISTKPYRPLRMVYKVEFNSEREARIYEKKIKTIRIEKERIIGEIESK